MSSVTDSRNSLIASTIDEFVASAILKAAFNTLIRSQNALTRSTENTTIRNTPNSKPTTTIASKPTRIHFITIPTSFIPSAPRGAGSEAAFAAGSRRHAPRGYCGGRLLRLRRLVLQECFHRRYYRRRYLRARLAARRLADVHSGMLPCFLGGRRSRLFSSISSDLTIFARVSSGSMMSSIMPRAAAAYGFISRSS